MKIRFKETPTLDYFGNVRKDIEYLVLGMTTDQYYILTDSDQVIMDRKDLYIITDNSRPEFWVEENGQTVPEEWLWKNFLSLNDEPYIEWDEIWFITQFAKGLERFDLPVFPSQFSRAYDKDHKEELVSNLLKLAADYDSLSDAYVSYYYLFTGFKFEPPIFRRDKDGPEHHQKVLMTTADKTGFDVLADILKQIGSPFIDNELDIDEERLQVIRNRILFSIWSIWGTKEFDVFQFKYRDGFKGDYMLKKDNDHVYMLTFDYAT